MTQKQTYEVVIEATREEVWRVLADLETAEQYDAFIERAFYVSEERAGVGATRRCELPDGSAIEERVIGWDEGAGYEIEASDDPSGALPLINQRARFDLETEGAGTRVRMTFRYDYADEMPIEAAEADGMAAELLENVLSGLKRFVETGERAVAPVPA